MGSKKSKSKHDSRKNSVVDNTAVAAAAAGVKSYSAPPLTHLPEAVLAPAAAPEHGAGVCVCVCVRACVFAYVWVCVWVWVWVYVCVCACMCVRVYCFACTYIFAEANSDSAPSWNYPIFDLYQNTITPNSKKEMTTASRRNAHAIQCITTRSAFAI